MYHVSCYVYYCDKHKIFEIFNTEWVSEIKIVMTVVTVIQAGDGYSALHA
jgi:hypothetical protein